MGQKIEQEISNAISRIDADIFRLLGMLDIDEWAELTSEPGYREIWELYQLREAQIMRGAYGNG